MKINRLLQIVVILINKGTVTARYLSDRFNVSVRTIYRDIDELTLSGIPIYTNKGKGGGISLLEEYCLNNILLSGQGKESPPVVSEPLNTTRAHEVDESNHTDISVRVWKNFIGDLDFDHELIKKEILNSWKRCKKNDVSLYDFDISILMKPQEKQKYVLEYLPDYQIAGFREFYEIVKNLSFYISIYDRHAKLKYIVNYDDVFDDLYPQVGYFKDVSENLIGTNSTCLALAEDKPFMVVGAEHYKHIFHRFSCAATPFYDEKGEIAGTVNASFLDIHVNNDTLNIIYSLARLYEVLVLRSVNSSNHIKDCACNKKHRTDLFAFDHILGYSHSIKYVKKIAQKASKVDSPVILYGESGSGKRMFAQAIHNGSPRKDKVFAAINCGGSIPKELIESELFGYEPGVFSGTIENGKKGLLEYASSGTLFIDEIDSMPMYIQVKLLAALSSFSVTRIGGFKPIPVDIRLICSSKKNLDCQVKQGQFREDLFNKINVVQINIPPLRERKEDIRLIANNYIAHFSYRNNIRIEQIDEEFFKHLEAYHWPGNVAQLINTIERALILSETGVIDLSLLSCEIKESYIRSNLESEFNEVFDKNEKDTKKVLQIAEEMIIERVLKEENYNYSKTAFRLGMSRPTLNKKMKSLDK